MATIVEPRKAGSWRTNCRCKCGCQCLKSTTTCIGGRQCTYLSPRVLLVHQRFLFWEAALARVSVLIQWMNLTRARSIPRRVEISHTNRNCLLEWGLLLGRALIVYASPLKVALCYRAGGNPRVAFWDRREMVLLGPSAGRGMRAKC